MRRDPGLAPVLSFFVWGLGFLYLGRFGAWLFWSCMELIYILGMAAAWLGLIGSAASILEGGRLLWWVPWVVLSIFGLWLLQIWLVHEAAEQMGSDAEESRALEDTERLRWMLERMGKTETPGRR